MPHRKFIGKRSPLGQVELVVQEIVLVRVSGDCGGVAVAAAAVVAGRGHPAAVVEALVLARVVAAAVAVGVAAVDAVRVALAAERAPQLRQHDFMFSITAHRKKHFLLPH